MEVTNDEANYTEQVRRLFQTRRCVESSFSPADQKLAASFFRQRVGLDQIETALLLGCARKYVAMLNGEISGFITSLAPSTGWPAPSTNATLSVAVPLIGGLGSVVTLASTTWAAAAVNP